MPLALRDGRLVRRVCLDLGGPGTVSFRRFPRRYIEFESKCASWFPDTMRALGNAATVMDADPTIEGHVRWGKTRSRNGFRLMKVYRLMQPDGNTQARAYGVSVPNATPNMMVPWPRRYSYHSEEPVAWLRRITGEFSLRVLGAKFGSGGNDPRTFTIHLVNNEFRNVSSRTVKHVLEDERASDEKDDVRKARRRFCAAELRCESRGVDATVSGARADSESLAVVCWVGQAKMMLVTRTEESIKKEAELAASRTGRPQQTSQPLPGSVFLRGWPVACLHGRFGRLRRPGTRRRSSTSA